MVSYMVSVVFEGFKISDTISVHLIIVKLDLNQRRIWPEQRVVTTKKKSNQKDDIWAI